MKEIKKVIFYSGLARIFREALIGNLYEISQVYPVILLAEELDDELKEILEDKRLFPKLEKIIFVHQHSGPKENIFRKNYNLRNLAKKVISIYKPDIVIAPDDIYPFEMYLMRFAKRINSLSLAVQSSNTLDCFQVRKSADLTNAYSRFPNFLPLFLRIFLVQCRKYLGHFLYYWVLPVLAGERPFLGKASYILRTGGSGPREGEFQIVFSRRDYDFHIKNRAPADKLYILAHPLEGETRNFFIKNLLAINDYKIKNKTATLLVPAEEMGFRRDDYSLIPKEKMLKTKIAIVKMVAAILKDWKIFIKPHPNFKNFNEIKNIFESISNSIEVVNPREPSNDYVKVSDVIIGLPRAATNVLFSASLLFPEKTIIALDFGGDLLGDFYKDFNGIEYVDSEDKFINILELIKNNNYHKKENKRTELNEFLNSVDLLEYLFQKNVQKNKSL